MIIFTSDDCLEFTGIHHQRTRRTALHIILVSKILLKQKFSLFVTEFNFPDVIDNGSDFAIGDLSLQLSNPDFRVALRNLLRQCPFFL